MTVCNRCGAFGDLPHEWREGDCVLPHRNHSRKLVAGSFVCVPCVERHQGWLVEVVELFGTLHEVLLAGSVPDDTAEHKRAKKAPASPSPLRLDAWALLHPERLNQWVRDERTGCLEHVGMRGLPDVADVLHNWAQAVFDSLDWTHDAPDTVSGAAAVLQSHAEDVARLADVDTYDAELRWVRRSLRDAHGLAAPTPLGGCLSVECHGRVWPNRDRDGRPQCDRCRRRYGTLDLVRLKAHEGKISA